MYQILFYSNKKGINEDEEYIKVLKNKKDKDSRIKYEKISVYLEILSKRGIKIGEPFVKHLTGELWELRPLRDRIIFGFMEDDIFVILNKFIKKDRKTPNREISRAYKLLKDYKEEIKNDRKKKK